MMTKFQKERIFSLYYGYRVLIRNIKNDQYDDKIICKPANWDGWLSTSLLELKPLSAISNEDAAHIAMLLVDWPDSMSKLCPDDINVRGKIDGDHVWDELIMEFSGTFKYTVRYRGGDFMTWINSNEHCEWNTKNHLQVYDFLRTSGYALPAYGYSVEDLVKEGVFRLDNQK